MSNKTLAGIGIGLYVLQVAASASDSGGNPIAPLWLIFFAGTGTLVFLVFAAIRLWKFSRYTAILLPTLSLLGSVLPMFMTQESSSINLAINAARVGAFLVYFYSVFLLFQSSKVQTAQT